MTDNTDLIAEARRRVRYLISHFAPTDDSDTAKDIDLIERLATALSQPAPVIGSAHQKLVRAVNATVSEQTRSLREHVAQPAPVVASGLGDGWRWVPDKAVSDMLAVPYDELRESGLKLAPSEWVKLAQSLWAAFIEAAPPSSRSPAPVVGREEVAAIIDKARRDFEREGPARSLDELWSRKAASEILALLPQEAAGRAGWRTIDSAPRDGTLVLLFGGLKGDYDWPYVGLFPKVAWYRVGGRSNENAEPTHWMPLPDPPAVAAPPAPTGEE